MRAMPAFKKIENKSIIMDFRGLQSCKYSHVTFRQ